MCKTREFRCEGAAEANGWHISEAAGVQNSGSDSDARGAAEVNADVQNSGVDMREELQTGTEMRRIAKESSEEL